MVLSQKAKSSSLALNSEGNLVTSTKDLMFTALVSKAIHFGLGPAPSRALAEQAGFPTYADFEQVYRLADQSGRTKLQKLLMHELAVVDVPPSEEAVLLRLVSLVHYTVDFLRRNPEEFVSFVHDQMLLALDEGAYWLQRGFIRASIESCYSFATSREFAFRYLIPGSRDYFDGVKGKITSLHERWLQLRAECDRLMTGSLRHDTSEWPEEAKPAFHRGECQYRIYNYYDARGEFQQVANILSASAQTTPQRSL